MVHFRDPELSSAEAKLQFCFGYWCFYVHRLRVRMLTNQFRDLPADPPAACDASSLIGETQEPLAILPHPVSKRVSTLEFGSSVLRYVPIRYTRYYVELSGTYDQYLQRFSRKRRGELRRKMRRFSHTRSNFFREYRSPEAIRDFYDLALTVSRQSYQQRLGQGLPEHPGYLAQLIRSAEQDKLRGYLLFFGDRPAAFSMCRIHGASVSGELCGYDSSLSQLSPGSVLIGYILEQLFGEQRFQLLDFGPGEASYKAFFATGSMPCADVYYFPRTIKNMMLVMAHYAVSALWSGTLRILNTLKIKNSLKKLARNGWSTA